MAFLWGMRQLVGLPEHFINKFAAITANLKLSDALALSSNGSYSFMAFHCLGSWEYFVHSEGAWRRKNIFLNHHPAMLAAGLRMSISRLML